ncbi:MAG TPA: prolyl oligopeptidase family serine peptidase [Gemmataceae bacterium]|nr:prolyl oligopeptidase family serine peptidase [Gemmataceae bacterium]
MLRFFFLLFPVGLLAAPPETPKKPVTDTYHGVSVVDPYRWLEDGKSDEVRKWSDAQNEYTRSYLDKLAGADKLRTKLKEIVAAAVVSHSRLEYRPGKLFAMKRQPPKEQPFLVVMPSPAQSEKAKTILDPIVLDAKGTTTIDWYVPSPDGSLVAVSISKLGSESGDVRIYETETGRVVLDEVIPRVQNGTAGGDLAWAPDGKGFYYTRYPRGDERPAEDRDFYQQLYFHQLGTPTEKDRYELGKDLPRIVELKLQVHNPTGQLLVTAQNGDGGEFAFFLREPDGNYRQFSTFKDRLVQATFDPKGDVLAVSRQDAPRGKILRLGTDLDWKSAKEIIPAGKDSIVTDFYGTPTVVATETRIYVEYQLGGPSEVRVFDLEGKPQPGPKRPPVSAVGGLTPLAGDDLLFGGTSFVEPFGQYLFNGKTGATTTTPLVGKPPVNLDDVRVEREYATSKDGTKIPVNILVPKRVELDGKAPCLVTGYGGYNISLPPAFNPARRVLFDHGMVVAVVNLRGGSEFGEEWHDAGRLTRKQNVFDDFTAACKHLLDRKYTSSDRLAIEGGSNGGLLMGAMLTQHPEMFKTVVTHVGIYDMLRVELSSNGAFNVPEYGTVKDPEQFKALYGYSPYHHVKDGVKYPATLFLTGANDPRVDPMQSRKMVARLQSATAGDAPILLRTSASTGHGSGTRLSARVEEGTDVYAFLFAQLGVEVKYAK